MTEFASLQDEAKHFLAAAKDHWTALTMAGSEAARAEMVLQQYRLAENAYLKEMYGPAARMAEAATRI